MTNIARNRRGARLAPGVVLSAVLFTAVAFTTAACVQQNPPTDVGNPVAPSSPSTNTQPPPTSPTPSSQVLSYNQDLKPIFDSDCTFCHSGSRPSAGYSMTSYPSVMRDVTAGNPNSRLIIWTQPGGSMYRFWTGNAAQKAGMVKQWVVANNAQQSR